MQNNNHNIILRNFITKNILSRTSRHLKLDDFNPQMLSFSTEAARESWKLPQWAQGRAPSTNAFCEILAVKTLLTAGFFLQFLANGKKIRKLQTVPSKLPVLRAADFTFFDIL